MLLEAPSVRPLEYGKLVVRDAVGDVVAARLEVPDAQRIRLVVADAIAA